MKENAIMTSIFADVNKSMDSWEKVQHKKAKIENAAWKKVMVGGHQLVGLRVGKSVTLKPLTEYSFQVTFIDPKNNEKHLCVNDSAVGITEKTMEQYVRRISYENSRKVAILRDKMKKATKAYFKKMEEAYATGEPMRTMPASVKQ